VPTVPYANRSTYETLNHQQHTSFDATNPRTGACTNSSSKRIQKDKKYQQQWRNGKAQTATPAAAMSVRSTATSTVPTTATALVSYPTRWHMSAKQPTMVSNSSVCGFVQPF
jgi:hypothetical protein